MADPIVIFSGPLTTAFQSSSPIIIADNRVVLDFDLLISGQVPVSVQWYPEFAEGDIAPATTVRWFREVAEEDIGNGDVRMPLAIRRFTTQGADAPLPPGQYYFTVQLKRTHMFCRIRILGAGCRAIVTAPLSSLAL